MTANSVTTAARVADPCCFVIFGASGDLTRRLLVPALYNLLFSGEMKKLKVSRWL